LSYPEREGGRRSQATSAISRADYKSKSYIALKEARESLYWIELLHRNKYIDDSQYESLHEDSEEPTNEARAEGKLACTMPCKEEEDEVNW